jgi:hypothetical protein
VKKPGNSSLFKAEVLCRSDYADLALLRVPDDNFWEGVKVHPTLNFNIEIVSSCSMLTIRFAVPKWACVRARRPLLGGRQGTPLLTSI